MICPNCISTEGGHYSNIEDLRSNGGFSRHYNPGNDPEWSYYECWMCLECGYTVYSYEDDFEYGDEE